MGALITQSATEAAQGTARRYLVAGRDLFAVQCCPDPDGNTDAEFYETLAPSGSERPRRPINRAHRENGNEDRRQRPHRGSSKRRGSIPLSWPPCSGRDSIGNGRGGASLKQMHPRRTRVRALGKVTRKGKVIAGLQEEKSRMSDTWRGDIVTVDLMWTYPLGTSRRDDEGPHTSSAPRSRMTEAIASASASNDSGSASPRA
jgi:hypothetical protein